VFIFSFSSLLGLVIVARQGNRCNLSSCAQIAFSLVCLRWLSGVPGLKPRRFTVLLPLEEWVNCGLLIQPPEAPFKTLAR
jgi:hypothetical protein